MVFHKKLKVSDKENINYEFLLSKNHEISKMSWWRLSWCYNHMNKIHIFYKKWLIYEKLWKPSAFVVWFVSFIYFAENICYF